LKYFSLVVHLSCIYLRVFCAKTPSSNGFCGQVGLPPNAAGYVLVGLWVHVPILLRHLLTLILLPSSTGLLLCAHTHLQQPIVGLTFNPHQPLVNLPITTGCFIFKLVSLQLVSSPTFAQILISRKDTKNP
jgi:hypothetical protein